MISKALIIISSYFFYHFLLLEVGGIGLSRRSLIHDEENNGKPIHNSIHWRTPRRESNKNDHNQKKPNSKIKVKPYVPVFKEDEPELAKIKKEYRSNYLVKKPEDYKTIVQDEMNNQTVAEEGDISEKEDMHPRASIIDLDARWPYEIWIQIDDNFKKAQYKIIQSAIWTINMALKCVKILVIPATQPIPDGQDYLFIRRPVVEEGCHSKLGRQGGRQVTALSKSCDKTLFGTAMHELIHVLGFYHEHTRSDRDDFVRVLWENFDPKDKLFKLQYQKNHHEDEFILVDIYDYESIMHYSLGTHMTVTDWTLVPPGIKIGQRFKLSDLDYERIEHFYPCPNPYDPGYGV